MLLGSAHHGEIMLITLGYEIKNIVEINKTGELDD